MLLATLPGCGGAKRCRVYSQQDDDRNKQQSQFCCTVHFSHPKLSRQHGDAGLPWPLVISFLI
jgi:hypothetical protein